MAITIVQKTAVITAAAVGPSGTMTLSLVGTAAHNTLILLLSYIDDSGLNNQVGSVADGVNSWNFGTTGGDSEKTFNHNQASIYSAYNIVGGNVTVTVTNNGSSTAGYMAAILYELAGTSTSAVNDTNGNTSAGQNSNNPISSTGLTLGNSGDIVFACFTGNDNTATWASGTGTPAGWTNDGMSLSNYPDYGFAHIFPGATTALTANFGSPTNALNWATVQAAYQPANNPSPSLLGAICL